MGGCLDSASCAARAGGPRGAYARACGETHEIVHYLRTSRSACCTSGAGAFPAVLVATQTNQRGVRVRVGVCVRVVLGVHQEDRRDGRVERPARKDEPRRPVRGRGHGGRLFPGGWVGGWRTPSPLHPCVRSRVRLPLPRPHPPPPRGPYVRAGAARKPKPPTWPP